FDWFAIVLFFFFQAEDGIRVRNVTGVQTCAVPIYRGEVGLRIEIEQVLRMVPVEPGVVRRRPVHLEEERGGILLLADATQEVQALPGDRVGEVARFLGRLRGPHGSPGLLVELPDRGAVVWASAQAVRLHVVED